MKFIIFADKSYNYIKPLADGLNNALLNMGHETEIWYDGDYWLQDLNLSSVLAGDFYRLLQNIKYRNSKLYIYRWFNLVKFYNRKRKKSLSECDCIIVVMNCPRAFNDDVMKRIEFVRDTFKKPIVNYDFHYLPNQAWWGRIQQLKSYKGLEKYDWYLPVGLVTEFAIPKEIPPIYTCIGMNINCPDLYPAQKEFKVLLDFPRDGHEVQRKQEIELLQSLNINYVELNGRYTTSEIRSIYRETCAYIVSSRESFGLPIVELQLCGAKIFTPHLEWVPAHFLDKSPFENGYGRLGDNFITYDGLEDLKQGLLDLKTKFNAAENVSSFKSQYPLYDTIDMKQLYAFTEKLQQGFISYKAHNTYKEYNKYISTTQDYETSDIK